MRLKTIIPGPDPSSALVPLSREKFAIIDAEDALTVGTRNWHYRLCHTCEYGATIIRVDGKQKTLLLHHFLIGKPPAGLEVDHINRNGLDNRRENLRFVTHLENMRNRGPYSPKPDSYIGSLKHPTRALTGVRHVSLAGAAKNLYRVRIQIGHKEYNFGCFKTIEEAEDAAIRGRELVFGTP